MSATPPLALWLGPAIALGAVVVGLVVDAIGRRALSVWVMAAGLAGASAAGFWAAAVGQEAISLGTFGSGAGFSGLPALGYGLGACAIVAGHRQFVGRDRGPATAAIVALGAVFSHALLASLDVVVTFVALAGLAIVGYALAASAGTRRAEESAVRYLVQGVIASGLAAYGLALVFGLSGGSTGYLEIASALSSAPARPVLLAFGLVLSAFAFKLGAFPFHAWVPDVYENADEAPVAFLASAPKVAATVAILILVRGAVFETAVPSRAISGVLLFLAVGSMVFGPLGMVRQRSVARLLGYSAIAQAGYALVGVAMGDAGVRATVVFVATYAVGVCAAFTALVAVRRLRPSWDGSLEGLGGLSRSAPIVAASLAVSMFSLTGIPIFVGFWGKLLILVSAVGAEQVWLAVLAAISAVVSFAAYGAVIRAAYFEEAVGADGRESDASLDVVDAGADEPDRGGLSTVVAAGLACVLVVGGLLPLIWGTEVLYTLFSLG